MQGGLDSQTTIRRAGVPLRQLELVEASYGRIGGRERAAAIAFYDELFSARPTLRAAFPREDAAQRQVAASFLGFIAQNLRSVTRLVHLLERLGERGLLRDVTDEDVEAVGKALLIVVRAYDPGWTLEVGHAWALTVAWTIAALRRGAARAPVARAG